MLDKITVEGDNLLQMKDDQCLTTVPSVESHQVRFISLMSAFYNECILQFPSMVDKR